MNYFCKFLLGIIGFILFFVMMIKGWGLSVKSIWPIILYCTYWLISLTIQLTIDKIEEKKISK